MIPKEKSIKFKTTMNQIPEMITCSDCGCKFDRDDMHWGRNNWNNNKFTDAKYAHVCNNCWIKRGELLTEIMEVDEKDGLYYMIWMV